MKDSPDFKWNRLLYKKFVKGFGKMNEITDLLSEKRLAKYKGISKEDAVACHLYNCELAESFYSSLSYFEIILRNKIDKVFSKYLGDDWILQEKYIIGRNQDNMKSALAHMKDTKKSSKDKNHIVSELSLGFWVYLFLPAYNDIIWKKHSQILQEIFDGSKNKLVLEVIFSKLNIIRMYRNKIFHYGSLLTDDKNPPARMHNLIYNIIKELNAQKLLKQLKAVDTFNEKYQKGKNLKYLK